MNLDFSNICDTWSVTPGSDANGQVVTNQYALQTVAIGKPVQPSRGSWVGRTPLGLYFVNFSGTITKP